MEGEAKNTFDILKERIIDYRDACQHLMSSGGDRKKALEFLNAAENFKKLQESLAKGAKIDILKLEPPISP
jgi:hypothetical protein